MCFTHPAVINERRAVSESRKNSAQAMVRDWKKVLQRRTAQGSFLPSSMVIPGGWVESDVDSEHTVSVVQHVMGTLGGHRLLNVTSSKLQVVQGD